MVLTRWLGVLPLVLVAGCSQSLFDNPGGGRDAGGGGSGDGGGGGDGAIPTSCPAPCLADAAGDFDGSPTGSSGRWRYLDDRRNRTWAAMTPSGESMVGEDPANQITTCAARPSAAACAALPGALLVSAAGATSAADPAIELTAAEHQVIKLTLRTHVPSGSAAQLVRLYRNSREDVLFTGLASGGVTLDHELVVDALAGDRFLLALAPAGAGAADVGVHLFANATGEPFPRACQLAVTFDGASATSVANQCGPAALSSKDYNAGAIAPALGAGPYPELGPAADVTPDRYYEGGALLDKTGDVTIQMWVRHDALVSSYSGWAFSDFDLDQGGGVGVVFYEVGGALKLEVSTCTSPSPLMFAGSAIDYPMDGAWRFVRIVHTGGNVYTCLDGQRVMTLPLPAGGLHSTYKPYLGRNVIWTPSGAFYDGGLDDVRVFSGALPCE